MVIMECGPAISKFKHMICRFAMLHLSGATLELSLDIQVPGRLSINGDTRDIPHPRGMPWNEACRTDSTSIPEWLGNPSAGHERLAKHTIYPGMTQTMTTHSLHYCCTVTRPNDHSCWLRASLGAPFVRTVALASRSRCMSVVLELLPNWTSQCVWPAQHRYKILRGTSRCVHNISRWPSFQRCRNGAASASLQDVDVQPCL